MVGLAPNRSVSVVQTQWHGTQALTLTHRDDEGHVADLLLYRDDEPGLDIESPGTAWAFDADGKLFKLASEAMRIRLAYLFDPYLAVHTSNIDPLPHQISAVYGELLPRQPLRFLLADDPGAGKTIMAGLFIKELIARGDLKRCLIVCPGGLVEQWQDELDAKLHVRFDIISRETVENSRTGNPYADMDLVISRMDHISRNQDLMARLAHTDWDLVVVDEAHKMSAHYFGNELKETKRYKLGKLLGSITRHLLLMTATPHSGKEADFQLFMALLDADRFEGRFRDGVHTIDIEGMMRRLVKEKLLKFDGRPLFPERRAYSVGYDLSDAEAHLYQEVTDYVRDEMNRAERLKKEGEGRRGNMVGFALTIMQRRLASSPEAIYQSIKRRRKRLEERLHEEELRKRGIEVARDAGWPVPSFAEITEEDIAELEDRPDDEIERIEEEVLDLATAAQTIEELKLEIARLAELEALAAEVRRSGTDRKWEELSDILQTEAEMFDAGGSRRKLIIFTEHRDTLNYLAERIRTLLGRPETVVTIHGGMGREKRREAQELFTQDKDVAILVATDAAGEGINLQRAHLLVNYDLPWNPNRIEQRFGRIHRIGQTEVCHMWNLVAAETREGEVFARLFEKLEKQRDDLGGQVFDVLGQLFSEKSLRDLLIEAIRYGEKPEVRAKLNEVVDEAMDQELLKALEERKLVTDVMTSADVDTMRERMEEAEARRLQPHFIRSFFMEAFKLLGGRIVEREPGRFEITHVPADVRNRDRMIGVGAPLLRRYERVTFEKALVTNDGMPVAQLMCPGHPLLDSVTDLVLERHSILLKKGAVLVAGADETEAPRALVYLRHAIQDGRADKDGNRRVVSTRLQFVEVAEHGEARQAGPAPYLDYRPATPEEVQLVAPVLRQSWLTSGVEAKGLDYAIGTAVPTHLEEVRDRTVARVEKTMAAVRERLTTEIRYWDHRANELKQQELAGKQPRMNSGKARQRADDLQARMAKRTEELEQEKQLAPLPPVVVGGALVVPMGLLARLGGQREAEPNVYARNTERVERIAVETAMATERALGREPREMPRNNPGYDILSKDPATGSYLFIEVKGRAQGAPTFTVTKNEILHGLNKGAQSILAMVSVAEDDAAAVRYLVNPFPGTDETYFDVATVNYDWDKLFDRARVPTQAATPHADLAASEGL